MLRLWQGRGRATFGGGAETGNGGASTRIKKKSFNQLLEIGTFVKIAAKLQIKSVEKNNFLIFSQTMKVIIFSVFDIFGYINQLYKRLLPL